MKTQHLILTLSMTALSSAIFAAPAAEPETASEKITVVAPKQVHQLIYAPSLAKHLGANPNAAAEKMKLFEITGKYRELKLPATNHFTLTAYGFDGKVIVDPQKLGARKLTLQLCNNHLCAPNYPGVTATYYYESYEKPKAK
jgi:hypothetical protein